MSNCKNTQKSACGQKKNTCGQQKEETQNCNCNCQHEIPCNKGTHMDMGVCGHSSKLYPMLQTYTTKVLQPTMCCGKKVLLTQQMMACEDYKYVIRWDFDLGGKTILVPENCILEFDGGTLRNGTIIGQDTYINDVGGLGVDVLFGPGLTREGTWRMNEGGGSFEQVQSDWNETNPQSKAFIKNKPADVGTKVQSDWNQSDSTKPDYIKNKPTIPSGGGDEDKPYDPDAHSGLGRKTLELGKDGNNILTQEDFDRENTIYVIKYDFDLDGAEIQIPKGCVLQFEGGSINNGTIDGNDAIVVNTAKWDVFKNVEIEPLSLVDGSYSQLKASMMIVGTKSLIGRTFYDKNGIQTDKLYSLKGLDKIYIKVTNTEIFTKGIAVFAVFVTENNAKWEQSPYINIPWHDGEVKEINIPEAYKNGYCGLSIIDFVSPIKYRRLEEGALLDYFDDLGIITNLIREDSITKEYNIRSTQLEDVKAYVQNIDVPDFSVNTDTLVATNYFNIGGIRENARWWNNYSEGYSTCVFDLNELRFKGYDSVTIRGKMLDGDTLETGTCRYFLLKSLPAENGDYVDFSNLGPANLLILGNNTITIPFPSDANYLAFLLCNSARTYIPASIVFKKQLSQTKVSSIIDRINNLEGSNSVAGLQSDGTVQKSITIGTWNIAHFQNGGVYTPDIEPEAVDTQLSAFRGVIDTCITKGVNVMGFNEFSEYFGTNSDGVVRTGYEALANFRKIFHFEQNYYADNTIGCNIQLNSITKIKFANMPAVWTPSNNDEFSRLLNDYYIECTAYINNHVVYLIFTHITWSGGVDKNGVKYQLAQYVELANKYKDFGYVAIIGDLNTSDYSTFTNVGFKVANTSPTIGDANFDNIIYKGFVVDNIEVINTDLSDHKPLIARLMTTDYTPIDDNKQNILAFGDAVIKAMRNGEKSFLSYIGKPYGYRNDVDYQATLSNLTTGKTAPNTPSIPQQILNENIYKPDVIVINGGFNDYYFNYPLGSISDTLVTTDEEANTLDLSTAIGGLEYSLYLLIKKWPRAKRIYVTTHKVLNYDKTANNQGYTLTDFYELAQKVCKKYNVAYANVYDESPMNTAFNQYKSDVSYESATDKAEWNKTYLCNSDGIHPSDLGYRLMYAPIVSKYIK